MGRGTWGARMAGTWDLGRGTWGARMAGTWDLGRATWGAMCGRQSTPRRATRREQPINKSNILSEQGQHYLPSWGKERTFIANNGVFSPWHDGGEGTRRPTRRLRRFSLWARRRRRGSPPYQTFATFFPRARRRRGSSPYQSAMSLPVACQYQQLRACQPKVYNSLNYLFQ